MLDWGKFEGSTSFSTFHIVFDFKRQTSSLTHPSCYFSDTHRYCRVPCRDGKGVAQLERRCPVRSNCTCFPLYSSSMLTFSFHNAGGTPKVEDQVCRQAAPASSRNTSHQCLTEYVPAEIALGLMPPIPADVADSAVDCGLMVPLGHHCIQWLEADQMVLAH